MVRFLENPRFQNIQDAIVWMDTEELNYYRLRFNTAASGFTMGGHAQTAGAVFTPHQILEAGMPIDLEGDTGEGPFDKALMHPAGNLPDDVRTSSERDSAILNPINHTAFNTMYDRMINLATKYSFKIYNYEEHPIIVGITVQVLEVCVGKDTAGVRQIVNGEDFGNDAYQNILNLPLYQLKKLQNTVIGVIPKAQMTGAIARTATTTGADIVGEEMHMNPGVGIISKTVNVHQIMTDLAKSAGHDGYDVLNYSAPTSTFVSGATRETGEGAPIAVWLWAAAPNTLHEIMGGVITDSLHHGHGLTIEGFTSMTALSWTGKIFVEPRFRHKVKLFDPKVLQELDNITVDLVQAS